MEKHQIYLLGRSKDSNLGLQRNRKAFLKYLPYVELFLAYNRTYVRLYFLPVTMVGDMICTGSKRMQKNFMFSLANDEIPYCFTNEKDVAGGTFYLLNSIECVIDCVYQFVKGTNLVCMPYNMEL